MNTAEWFNSVPGHHLIYSVFNQLQTIDALIPRFPLLGFLINYELLEGFRSWLACCVPFLVSVLLFAFGSRVWIALPRLIDFVPVPVGQFEPLGGSCPVMSDFMHAKLTPRFLLT